MAAISELILLAISFGALNSWKSYNMDLTVPDDLESSPVSQQESRSLYDLLAHFPVDKDITCPGSDSRFRYPGQCTRYVTCRNYQAHIRSCPPGMSFDQNYKQCRLDFEVDCEERPKMKSMCRPGEVYLDCGCERNCDTSSEDFDCADDCAKGCFCREGYARDSTGNCVTPEACENVNSVFSLFESQQI